MVIVPHSWLKLLKCNARNIIANTWVVFCSQADAPNTGLIPESDAVGVTVVLITCTYRSQEFIRIGYYVNNEYTDPELRENPPIKPDYTQVRSFLCSFELYDVNKKCSCQQHCALVHQRLKLLELLLIIILKSRSSGRNIYAVHSSHN